jgi:hypothetical protein
MTMFRAGSAKPAAVAVAAAAAIAAGVVGAVPASGSTSDHADAAGRPTAVVARTVLSDTKAVLTTTRAAHLTATVRLTVYRRTHGAWHSTGTRVVGKRHGWFWFVTSGPHAVCRFSVSNTPRRAVAVRLLVTPSIGCAAKTQHFHVKHGRLVTG